MNLAPSHPLSVSFPALLREFFCRRLIEQQNASPRTLAAYRDTFRLLLFHLRKRSGKEPSDVSLADLDAPGVLAFLDHLEVDRKNSIRTRNARLAAIRSFLKYAGLRDPLALPTIQAALSIPLKRFDQPLVGFLSREEVQAIMDAPDRGTRGGRRDRVLLVLMYNTGARVSEIAVLRVGDVTLEPSPSIRLHGKGRKERSIPL